MTRVRTSLRLRPSPLALVTSVALSKRTLPAFGLALAIAVLSSCSHTSRHGRSLQAVPLPVEITDREEEFVSDLSLREGERVLHQRYTLDEEGSFVLTRTIERDEAHLGVTATVLDHTDAERVGLLPGRGALVVSVAPGSAAALAGLRKDDVIRSFQRETVIDATVLASLISTARPGDAAELEFVRAGELKNVTITLGSTRRVVATRAVERTQRMHDDSRHSGLRLVEPGDAVRHIVCGPGAPEGLIVVGVHAGSPAYLDGLRHGDLLTTVDESPLHSIDDWVRLRDVARATRGGRALVTALRGDREIVVRLELLDDALAESEFSLAGLISYEGKASRSSFHLLWGLLLNCDSRYRTTEIDETVFYTHDRSWGIVLNLLSFESHHDSSELRLLWLFPISWKSARDD